MSRAGRDRDHSEVPIGTGTCIPFRAFNPHDPVRIYRRHMPHWRQDGATYFVTFRLADSIPRPVVERWIDERRVWLLAHGLTDEMADEIWEARYRAIPDAQRRAFERDEARKLFAELDRCHGTCHLRRTDIAALVADALLFHDGQRLRCGDFVVMPNHVHWLVQPLPGKELEDLLQSIRRFSATRINRLLGLSGPLWQKENYDHLVRDLEELSRIRRYIADNPGESGIVLPVGASYRVEWRPD